MAVESVSGVDTVRIEEFIEARLAEDEQIARSSIRWDEGCSRWADAGEPDWLHIARHDPARVLRQTAALRELLNVANDVDAMYSIAAEDAADGIRRTIAAIWAEHPDYQQEWADTRP
ncbi:hypothetical protein IU438_28775 [Nocardia cyriacigeorgica]|uniref:DUF6221 family protein n=1 Tax=Nocardia cyriacigeorgica TaxID=135487 RepID=UPI00189494F9|nr:DUF6221 family protein [Nocardia cyriacigeorgica]MBF6399767.1 hypothetical protein [Nocardia cyriacigeorgica]MBF6405404.1 hypothetical protein [Nocardia cyriacigeorgica]